MQASPLILILWRIFLRWEEITDVNLGLGIGFDIVGNTRHKNDWLRKYVMYYVSKNVSILVSYSFSLQDHEFIPTRQKTITASRPAADPGKFTKVPSNPLLISAQRQIMQAEEIRRRKESRERAEKAAAAAGLTTNTFLFPV